MADKEHCSLLKQGVEHWNLWRDNHPEVIPKLSRIALTNHELALAKVNLQGADLTQATLLKVNLTDADLKEASLQGANLTQAILHGAALDQTNLKGANLHEADLLETTELSEEQLALTDLSGAKLPQHIRHFTTGLKRIETTSPGIQQLFFALLAACTYCWLTIAATKDAQLLTETHSFLLPIFGVEIRVVDFYRAAPPVLICLYSYFHLYLQRLWEILATLPAVFPDGETLDMKSYPRHLSGFVRTRCYFLKQKCTLVSFMQAFLLILLIWGSVPLTLFGFWLSYLPRRDLGEFLLIGYLSLSMVIGYCFYRGVDKTFQDENQSQKNNIEENTAAKYLCQRFDEGSKRILLWLCEHCSQLFLGLTVLVPLLLLFISIVSITCFKDLCVRIPISWLSVFNTANLTREEVSTKLSTWPGYQEEKKYDLVQGPNLKKRNLRNASANWAFLAKADLSEADLRRASLVGANLWSSWLQGADLSEADLSRAYLEKADLRGANLEGAKLAYATLYGARLGILSDCHERFFCPIRLKNADLSGANLGRADLQGAILEGADLRHANLSEANLQEAKLQGANLQGANLSKAKLGKTKYPILCETECPGPFKCGSGKECSLSSLSGADLREVDLSGADLRGADLRGADLRGARLDGTILAGVNLAGADLTEAEGLDPSMLRKTCLNEKTILPEKFSVRTFLPSNCKVRD